MPFSALLRRLFAALSLALSLAAAPPLAAQDDAAWLQVEAQPDLATATERARAYSAIFQDVSGFASGEWFAIVLGPLPRGAAEEQLALLKAEGMIPADAYLTVGADYGARFWPPEGGVAASEMVTPTPEHESPALEGETLEEAKAGEAALSDGERIALQEALAWFGHYQGPLDGAFGKGSRAAFAAWQEAAGHEATGVLTTAQRDEILAAMAEEKARFGFETVVESEAGIEATLPLGLVAFEGYEPPFVQFAPRVADGPRVMLISEPGDAVALTSLFALLQGFDILPPGGLAELGDEGFVIEARSEAVVTRAWARLSRGQIKGYLVTWTPDHADEAARIAQVIEASFRAIGDKALDPGLVELDAAARAGLLTGLAPRRPLLSRAALFVGAEGAALTHGEGLARCATLTLDGAPARIAAQDPASGLALLQPETPLSPPAIAALSGASPRRGAEVVVAGHPWGDRLPAPVLTWGQIEELTDLDGAPGRHRLAARLREGDAGGPVLLATGAVVGLVAGAGTGGQTLPEGVAFSIPALAMADFMAAQGLTPAAHDGADLPPEALSRAALGMTPRLDCWQ